MTRIIAGDLRGRTIKVPDAVTRPTTSRVREAVLSSVQHAVSGFEDLRILDLYSGSGAFGIEAISRGAHEAVFVEKDRKAAEVIKKNLDDLKIARATVTAQDVSTFLNAPTGVGSFDVVFSDAPYEVDDATIDNQLSHLVTNGFLNDGAVVLVERSKGATILWPAGFSDHKSRRYGDTLVEIARYDRASESDSPESSDTESEQT
jgi:16S rRNA (guanine966-N2)-methyltransferase